MSPPDHPIPGFPRAKLPSIREVDATSGAPHTPPPRLPLPSQDIEFKGRGWSANIPAALVSSVATALVMWLTRPPAVPPEDTLRHDVREMAIEQRAQKQDDRETRAQQAQHEQQLNAVRVEVSGLRADVARLTRLVEEQQARR